jgi:hypothetical protein
MSFDSKEMPLTKSGKYPIVKVLNKSMSINNSDGGIASSSSMQYNNLVSVCKKCSLSKTNNKKELREVSSTIYEKLSDSVLEKRSMTFPKIRRSQDFKNKSWRTVFTKEKRPSVSLEALPAEGESTNIQSLHSKHRRNLSNPEGKTQVKITSNKNQSSSIEQQINFNEIDVRPNKPKILVEQVNPDSSNAIDDIGNYALDRIYNL